MRRHCGVRSKSAPAPRSARPGFTKFDWPSSFEERRLASTPFLPERRHAAAADERHRPAGSRSSCRRRRTAGSRGSRRTPSPCRRRDPCRRTAAARSAAPRTQLKSRESFARRRSPRGCPAAGRRSGLWSSRPERRVQRHGEIQAAEVPVAVVAEVGDAVVVRTLVAHRRGTHQEAVVVVVLARRPRGCG